MKRKNRMVRLDETEAVRHVKRWIRRMKRGRSVKAFDGHAGEAHGTAHRISADCATPVRSSLLARGLNATATLSGPDDVVAVEAMSAPKREVE